MKGLNHGLNHGPDNSIGKERCIQQSILIFNREKLDHGSVKKRKTLAWIETIYVFLIGLNPIDIDLVSMNHPQISHTQGIISGIFILIVKASYTLPLISETFKLQPPPNVWRYGPDGFNSEL